MKILYIHGYMGHGNGRASRLLREELSARFGSVDLIAPQFTVTNPEIMEAELRSHLENKCYTYIIASSMGGFYASMIPNRRKILVNPAMPEDLRAIRDAAPEDNPLLTDELLETLAAKRDAFFGSQPDKAEKERTGIILGDRDSVAHRGAAFFGSHYDHIRHIDMEHKLDETGAKAIGDMILETNNRKDNTI